MPVQDIWTSTKRTATPHRVQCGPCGRVGRPATSRNEAQRYAGVHDELHHRGAPTAIVRPC